MCDHRQCLYQTVVLKSGRIMRYPGPDYWTRKGAAVKYILPFRVRPGDKFVILCRVSSRQQGLNRNPQAQAAKLREAVETGGGVVIAILHCEWSGRGSVWFDVLLPAMAEFARGQGAVLLAATTDRFARSEWFRAGHTRLWRAQAQEQDLRRLRARTGGVPLMTYLHPDASPEECQSLRIKWAQRVKNKKGGRPRSLFMKPARRNQFLKRWRPRVLQLHAAGLKPRPIAQQLTLETHYHWNDTTVRNYLKEVRCNATTHQHTVPVRG